MSWGTNNAVSNNIHFNFPSIMNDSRLYTDYNSNAIIDKNIKKINNIVSNNDYRKYLQHNSNQIILNNQFNSCYNTTKCPYEHTPQVIPSKPYIFDNILSSDQPYGYENSDLKEIYLSRQKLNSKIHFPNLL